MVGLRGRDGVSESVAVVSVDAESEQITGDAPSAAGKKALLLTIDMYGLLKKNAVFGGKIDKTAFLEEPR